MPFFSLCGFQLCKMFSLANCMVMVDVNMHSHFRRVSPFLILGTILYSLLRDFITYYHQDLHQVASSVFVCELVHLHTAYSYSSSPPFSGRGHLHVKYHSLLHI